MGNGNEYKIIKKLGEGGFGIVYLAEKDNKKYALKQCKEKLNKNEIDQIKKIVDILSNINNDNLIKYYNFFMKNNTLNILMEYGGDMDLKKFINDCGGEGELIEEKIIKNIILQICKGLKEIHKNKIIHRDLTPDNIFIDNNKRIKIGDFGISKITTTLNNYANSKVGKFNYMAPEILKGTKHNNKVDIYSLGCIIYELFTLNEYYIDKLDEKDCKINTEIYNSKYQELIDLLFQKDYHKRPNIEEVISYINESINYIISEINIEEENINKDIRIINSYEEYYRHFNNEMTKEDFDKYGNEKELKNNCKIKINNNYIEFNYIYKFKEKGKYKIKYIFKDYITKCNFMFNACESLININLSNFNTKNVIDMSNMFFGCKSLTNIDLSNFNTQNVSDMSNMFKGCESLTNIDLSSFNTQNVKNMSFMFYRCKSLTNIDLSNFNSQSAINMIGMFSVCISLKYINLSNFNTKNVKNMSKMFFGCKSLTNINLSNFNTKNVINMRDMFFCCKSLTYIDLSNFNTQNVKDMCWIFSECYSLKKVITKDERILEELN